jgi:hypothetical protein
MNKMVGPHMYSHGHTRKSRRLCSPLHCANAQSIHSQELATFLLLPLVTNALKNLINQVVSSLI